MKKKLFLLASSLALSASFAADARDTSEKIPAPTLQLRAAGTLPQPQQIVVSSPIPAPKVEVVPVPNPEQQQGARYDQYKVDAASTANQE